MDSVLAHDDVAPVLLSFLSVRGVLRLACAVASSGGAHAPHISESSWRDLILTRRWHRVLPAVAVDNIETQALCAPASFSSSSSSSSASASSSSSSSSSCFPSLSWQAHFSTVARRDRAYVVVDPGTHTLKAGFSSEDRPACVISTSSVLDVDASSSSASASSSSYLSLASPSRRAWAHVLRTLLQILGVAIPAASVVLVLRPFDLLTNVPHAGSDRLAKAVPMKALRTIASACLEDVGVSALSFRWGPECIVHKWSPHGRGLVLESGASLSFCVPVSVKRGRPAAAALARWSASFGANVNHDDNLITDDGDNDSGGGGDDGRRPSALSGYSTACFSMSGIGGGGIGFGYAGEHLRRRGGFKSQLPVSTSGGRDLDALMQQMVLQHHGAVCTLAEARHLKEEECYVRARSSKWMPAKEDGFLLQGTPHQLACGKQIVLSSERFSVPEALLSPASVLPESRRRQQQQEQQHDHTSTSNTAATTNSSSNGGDGGVFSSANWSCTACTLINEMCSRACIVCGTAMPAAVVAALAEARDATRAAKAATAAAVRATRAASADDSESNALIGLVELVELALLHVKGMDGELGPSLFLVGGSVSFRDLPRRLHRELKNKGVADVTFCGEHGAWEAAAAAGWGEREDWVCREAWPSPAASAIIQRSRRRVCR